VPDQVVGLPDQLFAVESADGEERRVAIGDVAGEVGGGDQRVAVLDLVFVLSHWQIGAHGVRPRFRRLREGGQRMDVTMLGVMWQLNPGNKAQFWPHFDASEMAHSR
jgi:hypothetical protein